MLRLLPSYYFTLFFDLTSGFSWLSEHWPSLDQSNDLRAGDLATFDQLTPSAGPLSYCADLLQPPSATGYFHALLKGCVLGTESQTLGVFASQDCGVWRP